MPLEYLKVEDLPKHARIEAGDLSWDPSHTPHILRGGFERMANSGLLLKQVESFGFAAAKPNRDFSDLWDDPEEFVWFVAGWGPDYRRYIANAVRKLRAALRTGRDTLDLRLADDPSLFWNIVDSEEPDGRFKWGEYPWGGAVHCRVGNIVVTCAVSTYLEAEDHAVAAANGYFIISEMLKRQRPEQFGPDS